MSQPEIDTITQKLRNFHWGESIGEMRANFETAFTGERKKVWGKRENS